MIQKFCEYQIEWLTSRCDIELEPELEKLIVRFLKDTAECFERENEANVPDINDGDMISRAEAINALKGLPKWWAGAWEFHGYAQPPVQAILEPEDVVSAIENLPSVQPEIIHCYECKFYTNMRPDLDTGICSLASRHLGAEGFCSEAERRNGGEKHEVN